MSGFLRSGRQWPVFVVGIFSFNVLAMGALLYYATTDPSFAVEEDYYDKAVRWDESRRLQERSDALGWSASVEGGPEPDARGQRQIRVALSTRDGDPVAGAVVDLRIFHGARAADVLSTPLSETGPGVYEGRVPAMRSGQWQADIMARRQGDVFLTRQQFTVPAAGGRP